MANLVKGESCPNLKTTAEFARAHFSALGEFVLTIFATAHEKFLSFLDFAIIFSIAFKSELVNSLLFSSYRRLTNPIFILHSRQI